MKILVVSLLRIGDLLMAAPVIQGLQKKYPGARIDLLANKSSAHVVPLLAPIEVFHAFDRDQFQTELADPDQPVLKPFFRLEKFMSGIKSEKYDLVVNLTHNRLSGWLCGLIEGKETAGLHLDPRGKPSFGSPWFQYLNDRADARGKEIFHFTDIFWFGSGLTSHDRKFELRRTESGRSEANQLRQGLANYILVQAFTSESKKEWGTEHWQHALKCLQTKDPSARFLILGAPNERDRTNSFADTLKNFGVHARPAVCTFAGALSLMDTAELLLTGDTSIKHLAAATDCPVLEISLGSSDWRRTGIYKAGDIIIQPKVACGPCPHSIPCDQKEHVCALYLAPDAVAKVAIAYLHSEESQLQAIAKTHGSKFEILKTHFTGGGYWQALSIGRALESSDLKEWVDKLTTKMILEGAHLEVLGPYGTEATRMGDWMKEQFPSMPSRNWSTLIQSLDRETADHHSEALDAGVRLAALVKASRNSQMVELGEMRQLQVKIEDAERRLNVRRRLMRSLKDAVEAVL